jgi:hypothetical protein
VRTWFKGFPPNSINSWDALESSFLRQWGEKKDHLYFLTEFGNLKKKQNESVSDFIKRFNKLYNKIPADVKPSQPTAKVTFVGSFDPDFSLLLRERRSTTLTSMQDDAVEIESNMIASGKSRVRNESGERERRKQKGTSWYIWYLIQVDINSHPSIPIGSKQFSGNLLFLAVFWFLNFWGHFEGLNKGF